MKVFFVLAWSYRMDLLGEQAFKSMDKLEKHQESLLKSIKFIGLDEGLIRFKVKEFYLTKQKGANHANTK